MQKCITSKYSITATDKKKNINFALKFSGYNVEHNHDYFELFVVLDGKFEHFLNGDKSLVSLGNGFLLRTSDTHRFKSVTNKVEHVNIMIKDSYFKKCCKAYSEDLIQSIMNLESIKLNLSNTEMQILLSKLSKLESETDENKINLLEKILVNEIIMAIIDQTKILKGDMPSWFEHLLYKIKEKDNVKWNVDKVVSQCNYSKTHVERLFKKYTNSTIVSFLVRNKMEYASQYLLYSDLSIKDISSTVGYSDVSHFNNAFKKLFKTTPNLYRKTMTKDRHYYNKIEK